MRVIRADDCITSLLNDWNKKLAGHLKSDVLMIKSPIRFGLDDAIRHEIENLHHDDQKRQRKLSVVIETTGGYVEVVERIYNVLRKHYALVDFIVPNFAYSAGTVLVLSGDSIYMDYYSILGPIDPQFENDDGKFVPGLGYLQKYKELIKAINEAADPSKVRAQLAFLLSSFDPAQLFEFEQAREHSISLLEEWLPKHKFKTWKVTNGKKTKVTQAVRKQRAREIAALISDPERWHSHGRGIGIKELTSDEIKLEITNFGDDVELNKLIRNYYHLFIDYCGKIGARSAESAVLHTKNGMRRF